MSEELKPCRKCGKLDFEMWNGKGTQAYLECNECGQDEHIQVSDLFSDAERFSKKFEFNQFTLSYSEEVILRCKSELINQWNTRANPTFTKEDVTEIARVILDNAMHYDELDSTYYFSDSLNYPFEKTVELALNAVGKVEE